MSISSSSNKGGKVDWDEVVEWLKQDISLSEWLTKDEISKMTELDDEILRVWSGYQGFDIKDILRKMQINGKSYTDSQKREEFNNEIMVDGEVKTFRYSNHEAMSRDVSFICFIFSIRGSACKKIKGKSLDFVGKVMEV